MNCLLPRLDLNFPTEHHASRGWKTNDKRDLFVTVGNIYQKCIGKIHLFLCAPFMVCMCILISVKFYLLLFLTCQWWFVHSFYLISFDFCEIFPATLSLLLLDLCIVYCCELLHPICSKLTFVGATFPHNICQIWTVKTHFKIAFCEAAKPHLLDTKHNWADYSCYEFKLCNESDWNFWKCIFKKPFLDHIIKSHFLSFATFWNFSGFSCL